MKMMRLMTYIVLGLFRSTSHKILLNLSPGNLGLESKAFMRGRMLKASLQRPSYTFGEVSFEFLATSTSRFPEKMIVPINPRKDVS